MSEATITLLPSGWTVPAPADTTILHAAEVVILPGASHYDEVSAGSHAWPLVLQAIESALKPGR